MNLVTLINDFKQHNSMLWVEEDHIRLFVSDDFKSAALKDTIKEKKSEIIDFLRLNNIFSQNDFARKTIFRSAGNTAVLSFAQDRLWFIEQYEGGTHAYHLPGLYELPANIDTAGIEYAIQHIVGRHEVLRTTITQEDGREQQVVQQQALSIESADIPATEDYHSVIRADISKPFDLTREYPIRVKFYHIRYDSEAATTLLLINMHHIASDGWSMNIFHRELQLYYDAYINGNLDFRLPELEIQYKDFALWQKTFLSGNILKKQIDYWKRRLDNYPSLELPTDFARPMQRDYNGASTEFSLSIATSRKLRNLAQSCGVTLHSVMLSSMAILLGKYCGQEDITIGSPIANRHYRQTEDLIGFFVNTQVNRIKLSRSQSFEQLVHQVYQEQTEAQQHQDLPFERLVKELGIAGDTSHHPLFQVMFEVKSLNQEKKATAPETDRIRQLKTEEIGEVGRFDLSVFMDDSQEALHGLVNYASSLFRQETIIQLAARYARLLDKLAADPGHHYSSLHLLSDQEQEQVVYGWNHTTKDDVPYQTIDEIFRQQAHKSPDNIAVQFADTTLSYHQLHLQSNQLARHIRKQFQQHTGRKISPDTLIALCLDRSPELVISIIAILKAGAAFVPIDPAYPKERIDFIINDTATQLIICNNNAADKITPGQHCLLLADAGQSFYQTEDASDLTPINDPADLAYIIYTSGTTGKPKGVMITHKAVVNYNYWMYSHSAFAAAQIVDCSSSVAFDATVNVLITPLCYGQQVVICPETTKQDVSAYIDYIYNHRIELIKVTPSYLSLLLNHTRNTDRLKHLKTLILGGEKASKTELGEFMALHPHIQAIHHYGPTETTVGITSFTDFSNRELMDSIDSVPLGKVAFNNRAYILDEQLNPVPIGVPGILFISGANVARGYLNRPELTAEAFVPDPFASEEAKIRGYSRMYRTGDRVRWLQDGNIEFLGRRDDQVKIRGYRIELAEVEAALAEVTGIGQSCVIAKERKTDTGSSTQLVAYYTAATKETAGLRQQIEDYLAQVLPEYMIPSGFVALKSFPLNVNGKLDRTALPDTELTTGDQSNYVAPSGDLETTLCNIYATVLGLKPEQVSTRENFFRMGGDSILSIQVSGRIRQAGFDCRVKDIFEYKTVARLAEYLDKNHKKSIIKSEQGNLSGAFGLLPVQQWFTERVDKGNLPQYEHWNQSFLVKVPALDTGKLTATIRLLAAYHDCLRIRLQREHTGWTQVYQQDIVLPGLHTLDVNNCTEDQVQETLTAWQSNFNLFEGPLFRTGYLHGYADGSARVFFAFHHLITDTVSWRILAEDFQHLYAGRALPDKGSSYRQWTEVIRNYPLQHPEEAAYWEAQLNGMPSYPAPEAQTEAGEVILDTSLTRSLLQQSSQAYHTGINDLLLTALTYALKDINHRNVQGITLEGHGREDIDPAIDTSRTVGWFTTLYPVRLEVQNSIRNTIRHIKESLRAIPNKGLGFGAFAASSQFAYTHNDLSPISFNYLGQFDTQAAQYWQLAAEESGRNIGIQNPNQKLININGMVSEGRLCFSIVTALGQERTSSLCNSFKQHLTDIINHCSEVLQLNGQSFTPSDFPLANISQQLIDNLQTNARQQGLIIDHIVPANSLQQGFIYHALSQPHDDAYRVQLLYDYNAPLDVDAYLTAWRHCIAQYPILRTAFSWEEELVQVIYKQAPLQFRIHDISHLHDSEQRDAAIEAIQVADRAQPFDLSKPGLLRLHIIKQHEECYTILKTEHHSISDGWSGPVLLTAVHNYYQAILEGKTVHIKEDNAYLEAQQYICRHKEGLQQYWNGILADVEGANDINTLLSERLDIRHYKSIAEPAQYRDNITGALCRQMKLFAQQEGITLNVIIQFAWHKLLQVFSNKNQSIVGTTVSGRDLPVDGIEESVGLYINTLPLVINWEQDSTIREQLHHIQGRITELNTYSFSELAKIQKSGERIFHTLFIYENYPAPEDSDGSTDMISMRKAIQKNDYPLSLTAYEQGDTLTMMLQYDGRHLTGARAQHLLAILQNIIGQVVRDVATPHSKLILTTEAEYDLVIREWNEPVKSYTADNTIHQLFSAQAAQTPDGIALSMEAEKLTYRELDERSNQLARRIRNRYHQVTGRELIPGTLIALYMDRSLEMITTILAVLKAGAAYVPIDPSYPGERVAFILADCAAPLLITQQHLLRANSFPLPEQQIILADFSEMQDGTEAATALPLHCSPADLAYIIYTSGTTGRPKGVMVAHHQVVSFARGNNYIDYDQASVIGGISNYAFDGSVFDIFFSLLNGKQLVLISNDYILDLARLDAHITRSGIDTIFVTTALFHSLVQNQAGCLRHLRQLLFGGEACNIDIVNKFKSRHEQVSLIHVYGPTENIVYATYCPLNNYNTEKVVPIGRHLADKKLYLLDRHQQPVPAGAIGELYIGGTGVANGYLNNEALTRERFIPDPFTTGETHAFMYKTGDLVRALPGGYLEFIGRNDDQVKIRGFRIELGEIEHALLQIPGIGQSCAVIRERKAEAGNIRYIAAYYVPDANRQASLPDDDLSFILPEYMQTKAEALTADRILEQLTTQLPEYMLPSALIGLDALPLTINGKLDKRALPDPDFHTTAEEHVPPGTALEADLCRIWQEVLGLERVGITDDFFRLGGDSISSIRLVSKIAQIGINVGANDVLKHRNIRDLLQHINPGTESHVKDYAPFSLVDEQIKEQLISENGLAMQMIADMYPAGYLQSGMLVESFAKNEHAPYFDVLSYVVNAPWDKDKFYFIWSRLCEKNELLRTAFVAGDEGYMNVVYETIDIQTKIELLTPDEDLEQRVIRESDAGFDLTQPGLFRLFVLNSDQPDKFTFIFSLHHAMTDGWSVASLVSEFADAYIHGKAIADNLPLSYGKFIRKELHALHDDRFRQYWSDYMNGYEQKTTTLLLRPEAATADDEVTVVHHQLLSSLNKKALDLARKLKISPDTIFLGAYNLALSFFLNTDDLAIGTVVNNRLEEEGGDQLFGLHLNTIPVRIRKHSGTQHNARTYLLGLQSDKQTINEHKIYPYGKIKHDLKWQEDIYRCAFNYVHFHIAEENYENESLQAGYSSTKSNIPLVLNVRRFHDQFGFKLEGHGRFIDVATMEELVRSMVLCLEQMTGQPELPLNAYQLLRPEAYNQLVYEWNQTGKIYSREETIPGLFYKQVQADSGKIALVWSKQSFSYQELNEKSNQLAHHIRKQYEERTGAPLPTGTLVALHTDRGPEMIIAILAVMKAGAAYVPIDIRYPQERIDYILEDTGTSIILSQRHLIAQAAIPASKTICIDLDEPLYQSADRMDLPLYSQATDLAYVLYTSGTTGRPKGVMVAHKAFTQFINGFHDYLCDQTGHGNRDLLSLTNYVFDIFGLEYALPLLTGHQLCLSSPETVVAEELGANRIIQQTPGNMVQLAMNFPDQLSHMTCLVGGEALGATVAGKLVRTFGKVINVYGPAETVIWSSACEVQPDQRISIGTPLYNEQIYVLGIDGNPVPIGVTGELHIGGAGLARGYWNKPELTAEKFVPNRFATAADQANGYTRLYKTGDLARWLPDGRLEFAGRNDDQVKIRGHRVELQEIEHALSTIEGMGQHCVLIKETPMAAGNRQYLVAYYTLHDHAILPAEADIRARLLQILPEYMVPDLFLLMDAFPLTVNGKLDKRALPDPQYHVLSTSYTAPGTAAQRSACSIWEDVLETEQVGIDDNFFHIGGNSILAIRVAYRMNKALALDVKVADIFRFKTIGALLQQLRPADQHIRLVKPYQLDQPDDLQDLLMIHPATAGAEMYQELADKLSSAYNCIGVDNYNIHAAEKIASLNGLAHYYLAEYEKHYRLKEPVYLLGWSLGGQIALEMAYILEERGHTSIRVVLLDTMLKDDTIRSFHIHKNKAVRRKELEELLQGKSYEDDYIEKVLAASQAEEELGQATLSGKLKHTKITLFKAMQNETVSVPTEENRLLFDHYRSLKTNNIDTVTDHLKVIPLDCNHFNILDTHSHAIMQYFHILKKLETLSTPGIEQFL